MPQPRAPASGPPASASPAPACAEVSGLPRLPRAPAGRGGRWCGTLTPSPVSLLGFVFRSWANRDEVWRIMLNKERTYLRDKHFLQRHPLLQPKMRAILLDWLMEVSRPPRGREAPFLESSAQLRARAHRRPEPPEPWRAHRGVSLGARLCPGGFLKSLCPLDVFKLVTDFLFLPKFQQLQRSSFPINCRNWYSTLADYVAFSCAQGSAGNSCWTAP